MTGHAQEYNVAKIRELLLAAFTAEDLRRIFVDTSHSELRLLVTRLGPNDNLATMVDRVIDFCQTRDLWPEFLQEVKQANPNQYLVYEPQLRLASEPEPIPKVSTSTRPQILLVLCFVFGIILASALVLIWRQPLRCLLEYQITEVQATLVVFFGTGLAAALTIILSPRIRDALISMYGGIALVLLLFIVVSWRLPPIAQEECRPPEPQLIIDTPADGSQVDVQETAIVRYIGMPRGWHLRGVTHNPDGTYHLFEPEPIQAGDGEQSLAAYFGDRTYGIGAQYEFFVIALQTGGEMDEILAERPPRSSQPLPQGEIYRSQVITVTRVGPVDRWYADYGAQEGGGFSYSENIESCFLFKNWGDDAPSEQLPQDQWYARFVRRVQFPVDGAYRLYAERDDGLRVWVDDELVIDAWTEGNLIRESQVVTLTQGYHEIALDFFDNEWDAELGFWFEELPSRVLRPQPSERYWLVDYYPNMELFNEPVAHETFAPLELDIYWGGDTGVPLRCLGTSEQLVDHFSTRSSRTVFFEESIYHFEIEGDDGVRVKVDDRLLLEKSGAWYDCSPCSLRVDLAEGPHNLVVEHWDTTQDAHVSLKWKKVAPHWQSLSNPYIVDSMTLDDNSIWTGGSGGLVQWDKRLLSPTIFHSEDGVPSNLVNALLVDRNGTLWIGTGRGYDQGGSGLGRYDGEKWQTLTTADGLCHNAVFSIFEDVDDSLWIGTGWGLTHYTEATDEWHCYHTEDGLGSNYPGTLYRDSRGDLWVRAGGTGISVLRADGAWETYPYEEIGIAQWGPVSIVEDRDGNLWFSSWAGALRYDGERWDLYTEEDDLPHTEVLAMSVDQAGDLWFGTPNGVARYDGVDFQVFTSDDGLRANHVTTLLIDENGILWAGHRDEGGISRFDGTEWLPISPLEPVSIPNTITVVTQDRDGMFWIGSGFPPERSGDGLYTFDRATVQAFDVPGCLERDLIDVIFQDGDGNFWFGYDVDGGGVTRFDGESCHTFTAADGLAGNEVDDIIQDHDGYLWFATSDGGISQYDGTSLWRTLNVENGTLPANDLNAVFQDSTRNLWFGMRDSGLVRYDGESFEVFTVENELVHNQITDIIEDTNGVLWFGTFGGGISTFDPADEVWNAYQQSEDGLLSDRVYSLFVGKNGWIWAGTDDGIGCYTGRRWLRFTPADGLAGRNVQDVWEDENGAIWLATGSGIGQLQWQSLID